MLGEHREVVLRAEPAVSPSCGSRLSTTHDPGVGARRAPSRSAGTSRCGITEVNHEPGPEHHPVGVRDRLDRLRAGRRVGGYERAPSRSSPSVVATSTWPRTVWSSGRVAGSRPAHLGGDVHRGHAPSAAPDPGRRAGGRPSRGPSTWSPSSSHSPTMSRLPTTWPCISPVAGEAVLQHLGPGAPPVVVAAERGERHPQVAGRQHAELAAQPAGRAAVVGDRDDRGQRRRRSGRRRAAAARAERGGSPWPPPSGDHRLGGRRVAIGSLPPQVAVHARGRRRRARGAGATISSDIATLRCLPPVQPMATVHEPLALAQVAGGDAGQQLRYVAQELLRRPACSST